MRYLMIHKIDESRPEAWNSGLGFHASGRDSSILWIMR